jgi:hypothetical protein
MFEGLGPRDYNPESPAVGSSPFTVQQHVGPDGEFNRSLPDKSERVNDGKTTTWRYTDLETGGQFKFYLNQHISLQMYEFDLGDADNWELYIVTLGADDTPIEYLYDQQSNYTSNPNVIRQAATSRSIEVFHRWTSFELKTENSTTDLYANLTISRW